MLNPKKSVFNRFEQTFILFKNNFIKLFLPVFLFNFIFVIFWIFIKSVIFIEISGLLHQSQNILNIIYSNNFLLYLSILSFVWIIYLFLFIIFFIFLIRSIKQSFDWKEITIKENIYYWFSNIWWLLKTYWYIFIYITFIPLIFFFIWSIFIFSQYFFNLNEIFKILWFIIFLISILLFCFFFIYRKLKSYFSLYCAIDNDNFTQKNFFYSINLTNSYLLKIIWNLIVVIIWLWIFSIILSLPINFLFDNSLENNLIINMIFDLLLNK